MDFQINFLEKAYFIARKCGPAMVWQASSVFSKAPWDSTWIKKFQREYTCTVIVTCNLSKKAIKCVSK